MSASFSDSLAAEINSVSRAEVHLKPNKRSYRAFSLHSSFYQLHFLWPSVSPSSSWWRLFTNRRRSTTGSRTTLTKSLWPSWSPTLQSWRSNRAHPAGGTTCSHSADCQIWTHIHIQHLTRGKPHRKDVKIKTSVWNKTSHSMLFEKRWFLDF